MIEYHIGVDGGGTGTRVRFARSDGTPLGEGGAGPSGLMHGIANAWAAVDQAIAQACGNAGIGVPPRDRCAIGLGLAGVHNKEWAAQFVAANPGYAAVALETDASTTLLGAHEGRPGAIIALGTGSVGEIMYADGTRREVGGWGFPAGDEAGGAWIGLAAVNHVQHVIDGRARGSAFADAVIKACGGSGVTDRDSVQSWLAGATQTKFAQIARQVLAHAETDDKARAIMLDAGRHVALIADALDPTGMLPIALCGGLGEVMPPYLPAALRERILAPRGDSASGALRLIRQHLAHQP
ncbi:glucosamine kinase [Pseudoduganella flava]|uniref:ATPase n=1 Tax=Pseudoduganella flava TaxID=871742 RepID=A0A562Q4H5_9BURK|nr:BadF/BadG/BcrA/BcrD ATPase family protein [Pseudoduganella flava]QGZ41641.1 ATPase [Pseudoduganella flava]TWI51632.1 glucosamine kinase [Pseudoduganella flava]